MKIKTLYINQFKGFKNFNINFENDINLLVGENGSGKTTIFEIIFNALSGNKQYFENSNLTQIKLELQKDNENYKITVQENNKIEILINDKIADLDNEFFKKQKVVYLPAEVSFTEYNINSPTILKEENRDLKLDANKISKDFKIFLINEKILDLNDIANGNYQNAIRILKLKELFNDFFEDKKFIDVDVNTYEPIFELKETKKIITLDKLSSGEKQIFYKGGALLQYTKKNSVIVLLDEPETSLHPEWQQKILNFYKNINTDNQYIFATHSAHIVACCNKEKIRLLVKEKDYIILKYVSDETYGASNEELLYNIFDLNSVRNLEIQKDIDEYKELFYRKESLNEDESKRLEELKQKLVNNKALANNYVTLLELGISNEKTNEYLNGLRGNDA